MYTIAMKVIFSYESKDRLVNSCEKKFDSNNKRILNEFLDTSKSYYLGGSTRPADKKTGGLMIGTCENTSRSSFSIESKFKSPDDILVDLNR